MKKRNAFTMIELIFVIVILGILGAVAIPKLSATRDDAKIARLAQMVMAGSQEIASYAVANGETNNSFAMMSNSFDALQKEQSVILTTKKAVVKCGNVHDCVTIEVNTTTNSDILQITRKPSGGSDEMCIALQRLIDENVYPIFLRGQLVVQ